MSSDPDATQAPEPAPVGAGGAPSGQSSGSTVAVDAAAEKAAQSELDLGMLPTGSADVDRALLPLDGLADRAVADHTNVFEEILQGLTATMTDQVGTDDVVRGESSATS